MGTFEGSERKAVSVGPFGGQHGLMWYDGVYSTVKQLVIAHGSAIDSIQVEYDEKGASFWSDRHGGNGGWRTDKVKLACPEEYLTSIEGHYGKTSQWGPVSVRSLTFKTNKRTYGPFGLEKGTPFSIPEIPGSSKIVGFHGRAGGYLDAIGAYINPLNQNEIQPSKAMFQTQFNNYIAGGTDNLSGYSVLQNCDVFFAIRPKFESSSTNPAAVVPPGKLTRQFSSNSEDLSDVETQVKTPAIERYPSRVEGVVTYGPWGGTGGFAFDDGVYSGIRQIKLSRNVGVVLYIKVQYDRDGEAVWRGRHGGTGGYKHDKVIFDYPNEILTHITGTIGPAMMMGPSVIKSLTFHTTKTKHGPYGEEQGGNPFTTKLREGKIVGIHGRSGLFLDALGVHAIEGKVMVETHTPPVTNTPNTCTAIVPKEPAWAITESDNPHWTNKLLMTNKGKVEEAASAVIKEPAPCGPGPWGGDGGRSWDDGVFCGIRQIHLTRAAEGICSMQIEYDRMGQFLWSVKHGGNGGTTPHRIKLEYPHEVLICITGYYGCISKDERLTTIIKSLSFYTSRGKYGPFGEEVGTFFTSTTTEGKVVGFHGRSSLYLDAIGVHMQHWLGNTQRSKPLLFKMF